MEFITQQIAQLFYALLIIGESAFFEELIHFSDVICVQAVTPYFAFADNVILNFEIDINDAPVESLFQAVRELGCIAVDLWFEKEGKN